MRGAFGAWAGEYPRRWAREHAAALEPALSGDPELDPSVRNLAPVLIGA